MSRPESDRSDILHEAVRALPAAVFQFDERMRDGWLTDRYFTRAASTLAHDGRDPVVTLQVFNKRGGVLAGAIEAVRMLETQVAPGYSTGDLAVATLLEGDSFEPWETVMHIQGPYRAMGHLETTLLGVLARRTRVATQTRAVVEAAAGRDVIFMGARHDDWRVQTADGYAARVGGAAAVTTDAGGDWWGGRGVGTMPHATIAAYGGDTVAATLAFARYCRDHEPDVRIVSLVDYDNDVVGTSLSVARAMEAEFGANVLSAVRVDTSETLMDRSLMDDPGAWGRDTLTGVNPTLVRRLRRALDDAGFPYVGIMVSGGFTPDKIRMFERLELPVVGYGVGSSLLHGNYDFTADVVRLGEDEVAKAGRRYTPNHRLVRLEWARITP